ncbi:MAG: HAMP domain-containing histidine kinase [Candidatus Nomurabacteria bacterium]|jgi:signal transduction histidine kinase|nr:HAMP domain-containing histidine kinase [Candidatus Nomurabacteria bacterium]
MDKQRFRRLVRGGTMWHFLLYVFLMLLAFTVDFSQYHRADGLANYLTNYWPEFLAVLALGFPACYLMSWVSARPIRRTLDLQHQFIADAGHELRTPLAELLLSEQLIAKNGQTKMTKADILREARFNHSNLIKLETIVENLLRSSDVQPTPLTTIDLGAKLAHGIRKSNSRRVQNKIRPRSVEVRADPEMLEYILFELIENALHADATLVTLSFSRGRLSVADNGHGIARGDLPHIFERFYRTDASRSSDGYGLGLNLVRHMALRQNLTIKAKSRAGAGSIFTLKWPRGAFRQVASNGLTAKITTKTAKKSAAKIPPRGRPTAPDTKSE